MYSLGNICRSPIAEAVFIDEVKKAGVEDKWEIDSAAIGSWHVGRNPDSRALATMKKHDLPYSNKARQVSSIPFSLSMGMVSHVKLFYQIFQSDQDARFQKLRLHFRHGRRQYVRTESHGSKRWKGETSVAAHFRPGGYQRDS